ncbi:methylated-DNA--[protein]-cysteine S-methyltransferase [Rathayibacter soli]|uniref:methylated-DNA--[protein]-cysteine S-methyltransferase n=1 Tax=Rathayibacter soli TaxID=3144168 RepID=UPI0027E4985A|nr:methylated-DNA--[protein]-cysteine S-methyltransferase [Glaciibacter superstes]
MTETFDHIVRIESPIGRLELTSDGARLNSLTIARGGVLPHDDRPERSSRVLERAHRQLDGYFECTRRSFTIPLAYAGTPFQRLVWQRIAALRWGERTSYRELGIDIGRPEACRAIGGAVAANPLPIIIGCHRVLSSTGRVVGYTGGEGIPTKLWLLEHEAITLAA